MRTSFHHQPEAQHPNFPLSVSWQADYPIFWRAKRTCAVVLVSTASVAHDPKRLEQDFCREETSRNIVCCDVLKLACGLRAAYIYEGIDAPPFTAAQCPQGLRVRSAKRKFYARRRRVVCHAGRGKPASQGTRGDARHQALQPGAAATRYNERRPRISGRDT